MLLLCLFHVYPFVFISFVVVYFIFLVFLCCCSSVLYSYLSNSVFPSHFFSPFRSFIQTNILTSHSRVVLLFFLPFLCTAFSQYLRLIPFVWIYIFYFISMSRSFYIFTAISRVSPPRLPPIFSIHFPFSSTRASIHSLRSRVLAGLRVIDGDLYMKVSLSGLGRGRGGGGGR